MYYIGIDIGGTKMAVVLSDKEFNILDKEKFETNINENPHSILDKMEKKILYIVDKNNIHVSNIISIGISSGGPLDSKKGIILGPPNLPKWENIKIKEYFEERFNRPTYLLNDANACSVAEWKLGAGKDYENLIFLTFGTGMGAGLILNGKLYEGIDGQAGEVGHIRIGNDGPYGYGKYGSFESYCSGTGIRNLAIMGLREKDIKGVEDTKLSKYKEAHITAALIFEFADLGDVFCKEIIKISANKLGLGLSILIDIFNPEVIIIGSIYTRARQYFDTIIEDIIKKETLEINRKRCKITPSILGDNIGDYAALITASGKY